MNQVIIDFILDQPAQSYTHNEIVLESKLRYFLVVESLGLISDSRVVGPHCRTGRTSSFLDDKFQINF